MNPIIDRLQGKKAEIDSSQFRARYKHLYDSVKSYDDLINILKGNLTLPNEEQRIITKVFTISNIVPLVLDLLNEEQRKELKNIIMAEPDKHVIDPYSAANRSGPVYWTRLAVVDSVKYALNELARYYQKGGFERVEYCPHIESFSEIMKEVAEKNSLEVKLMNESSGEEVNIHRKVFLNPPKLHIYEKEWAIFDGNERTYKVQQKYERIHEFGQGGHDLDLSILSKTNEKDEKLLESKDLKSWSTQCDDSVDYEGRKEDYTILYSEDKFARGIFEEIRERFLEFLERLIQKKR